MKRRPYIKHGPFEESFGKEYIQFCFGSGKTHSPSRGYNKFFSGGQFKGNLV